MKKTRKKAKGIEEKIRRIEFYENLRTPPTPEMSSAQDILRRIRARSSFYGGKR